MISYEKECFFTCFIIFVVDIKLYENAKFVHCNIKNA